MEMSEVEIRKDGQGNFEAVQRGDYVSGAGGYFVIVTGWGLTEADARASLRAAFADLAAGGHQ
jgi:hypothetical protein